MTSLPKEKVMSSRGKKKTTMAKLTRESRLRERRMEKQVRKDARHRAAAVQPSEPGDVEPVVEHQPNGV
jgi:hypothetical protein